MFLGNTMMSSWCFFFVEVRKFRMDGAGAVSTQVCGCIVRVMYSTRHLFCIKTPLKRNATLMHNKRGILYFGSSLRRT